MTALCKDTLTATKALIQLALAEDIGAGDLTARAVPESTRAKAKMVAKEDLIFSGAELPQLVLDGFGARAKILQCRENGDFLKAGDLAMELEGNARDLLTTERTLLNLLQRLCGVASQAHQIKVALGNLSVKILDTRKTTPGLRYWEKRAVKDGGLFNHRSRLDDGILVKENHIRAAGSISAALKNLGTQSLPVEVEVTNLAEALEALENGVFRLLLDNFSPEGLREIVSSLRQKKAGLFLEASGGISPENFLTYAKTGVDALSMGALTHSVKAADLSLLFEFQ